MPSDWPEVHLEDVASEVTVGFVGPMASEYLEEGVPFLRSLNIEPLRIKRSDLRYISDEFHKRICKSRLTPGDVVIVRTGKPGACAVVPEWLPEANCSDLVVVRPGPGLDASFLSYYVNSAAKGHIAAHLVGAVQQHFNVGSAKKLLIRLPPLPEQLAIAGVLGSLDDKIELNRRMNRTLESMARALFKSWFVDFDPVHANAAGKPSLPPDLAAHFPAAFAPSPLGDIPKGWEVVDFERVASVVYGAPFASKQFNKKKDGLPLLRIRDLKSEKPGVWTTQKHPKGRRVTAGDIVVGMDGEFRAYLWGGEDAWMNQRVCLFEPVPSVPPAFALMALEPLLAEVERGKTGTTVIHIGKGDIDRFTTLMPPEGLVEVFGSAVQSLYDQIVANKREARTLTALRDALLPKLLGGELECDLLEPNAEVFR